MGKKCNSRKRDDCHLSCETGVDVDLSYCPRVRTKRFCKRNTSFDVVLDMCARPRCCIRQKHQQKKLGACREQCVFTVDVDCDFDCQPCIVKCKENPRASFDLEVDIDTRTRCHQRKKRCHR